MKKEFGQIPDKTTINSPTKDKNEEKTRKTIKNQNLEKKETSEKSKISQKEPNIAFRIIKKPLKSP